MVVDEPEPVLPLMPVPLEAMPDEPLVLPLLMVLPLEPDVPLLAVEPEVPLPVEPDVLPIEPLDAAPEPAGVPVEPMGVFCVLRWPAPCAGLFGLATGGL